MEKELGIENKQQIYEYGVDKFIQNCREFAQKNLVIMNEQFKRLGCFFWDWDNPYITFKNSYIEGIWWTLKKAWENNLLYQFYRPLNCCPRCATALAKHEHEYKNIIDVSLFLKIKSVDLKDTYFIIWTTTPWTLVANEAIMANPFAEYAKVKIEDLDEYWILGKNAIVHLISGELGYTYKIVQDYIGEDLEGMKYIHPLIDEVPYQKELEIPVFNPVDIRGIYTKEAGIYEGKFVFDANTEILDLLKKKGTLIFTSEIEHEYAHCWRCDSKLVYRATNQWFFKTESLVPELLEKNSEIYWVPDWAGNRWFKSWLSTLKDWCISRQRFWGIPLSVWICDNEDCHDVNVIGSSKELKEYSGEIPEDLHRPWIDQVTWECKKCGKGTKKRIPDILDVWLDSGSVVWAAQEVYDGKNHYDTWIPADFILEGKDQIRGWFNTLLCSAMVSSKRKNYDACYMHGWTLRNRLKMSKSKGNQIFPEHLIEGTLDELEKNKSYSKIKGIETFRFYSIGVTQPGRDFNFNTKEYADTFKVINTIWNVYVYTSEKLNLAEYNRSNYKIENMTLNLLDKWIISRLNSTIKRITELSDDYKLPWITSEIREFVINDISRWYIMLNREELDIYSESSDKFMIMTVLFDILFKVLLLLAPINPMLTEEIYQKMFKPYMSLIGLEETESIHLHNWPIVEKEKIDIELEEQMLFTKDLIEFIRALKEENKIRMRWPNKKIIIEPKEGMPKITFPEIVKKVGNVKDLTIEDSVKSDDNLIKVESKYCNIYLDTSLDDELLAERVINELIRNIQYSRKRNNFKVGEQISLSIGTNSEHLKNYVEINAELLSDRVTAKKLEIKHGDLSREKDEILGVLDICSNKECSASLKENTISKVKKNNKIKCPYCNEDLKEDKISFIKFKFSKLR